MFEARPLGLCGGHRSDRHSNICCRARERSARRSICRLKTFSVKNLHNEPKFRWLRGENRVQWAEDEESVHRSGLRILY